jgi:hypothetical protein
MRCDCVLDIPVFNVLYTPTRCFIQGSEHVYLPGLLIRVFSQRLSCFWLARNWQDCLIASPGTQTQIKLQTSWPALYPPVTSSPLLTFDIGYLASNPVRFYSPGMGLRCSLVIQFLDGNQIRSGHRAENKSFLPYPGIEPRYLSLVHILISILSSLFGLYFNVCMHLFSLSFRSSYLPPFVVIFYCLNFRLFPLFFCSDYLVSFWSLSHPHCCTPLIE